MTLTEKFLDYVTYETTSNEESTTSPSTFTQFALADHLVEELKRIGVDNACRDEYGYVYGSIEANADAYAIGFMSHMDTSEQVSGKDIKTRIIENYDGKDIELSEGIYTTVQRFENLKDYTGKTLIVTDGKTLLGADDKAGISEIMQVMETLVKNPEIKHGLIRVCFNPDEEVGRGTEHFDYDNFKVDFAYTLDGGKPNEVEYECFNAASATVKINGVSTHPGSAKGKMINALNVANEFHQYLPVELRPEYTEGYEGFNCLMNMTGSVDSAELNYIIRNHDRAKLEAQKNDFLKAEKELNEKYGEGTVNVLLKDSYKNMKECFTGKMESIELVRKAMKELDMDYKEVAIRGGTDGAALSFNGIPCPNLGTGGQNFHGVNEFACVEDMEAMVTLVLKIIELSVK